ncbi:MAG: lysophospholipid acyltransferase family protein [Nitrospirales bacterium]|nr:lysophospholipid acyltransferase family protein [Nitrospirales bacterium]
MMEKPFSIGALIIRSLLFPFALIPYRLALRIGEGIGLLAFSLWSGKRKIAIENISLSCLDQRESAEEIARESFKNLGRSTIEALRILAGRGEELLRTVEIRGLENYERAKAKGKGVIAITGHCGSWELMAVACGSLAEKGAVVARPLDSPVLNGIVEEMRQRYGNRVIYKKDALRGIISVLRKNSWVGILIDQAVVREEGLLIGFLGRWAWAMKMPAIIARRTGAAVVPIFIHREGRGHVVEILPEVPISGEEDKDKALLEDTQTFSSVVEGYVRAYPAEWLWLHRRWKRAGQPLDERPTEEVLSPCEI